MSSIIKNSVTILGLVVVLALGYYLFVIEKNSPAAMRDGSVVSQADIQSREFLNRLTELESLELPVEVLRDSRIRSLVDNSTTRRTLPVGRTDPFADVN